MVDLNGHEAGNGGHSQGKPTAYRDSSTRRDRDFATVILQLDGRRVCVAIGLAPNRERKTKRQSAEAPI
jgi:hypothetical protein